ncbi:MAG: MmcQ/YjbR family DNA-binding protein [Planctomycetes bacterium]|nr:MmcQ/YjbR family DNA-binding protein [Planctomycetota bacterium]
MNADDFRGLALSFPGTEEKAHMAHPDFRVGGKIFASLTSNEDPSGMVKVSPAEQAALLAEAPLVYRPANGAWGRQGCTLVRLAAANETSVRRALAAAWRGTAPKRLAAAHPEV